MLQGLQSGSKNVNMSLPLLSGTSCFGFGRVAHVRFAFPVDLFTQTRIYVSFVFRVNFIHARTTHTLAGMPIANFTIGDSDNENRTPTAISAQMKTTHEPRQQVKWMCLLVIPIRHASHHTPPMFFRFAPSLSVSLCMHTFNKLLILNNSTVNHFLVAGQRCPTRWTLVFVGLSL